MKHASNLLLFSILVPTGVAFIPPPPRLATGARSTWGEKMYAISRPETSNSGGGTVSGEVEDRSEKSTTADFWRSAIWQATDAVIQGVESGPSFEQRTNETLASIAEVVKSVDKYVNEINSATTNYLKSISPGKATKPGTTVASGGSPKDDKPKKATKKTVDNATSAVSTNVDAAVPTMANVKNAAIGAVTPVPTMTSKTGSASGMVQLDRPKEVQGVFDKLQKKAVEDYKSSPAVVPSQDEASGDVTMNVLPEAALSLEKQLESILKDSKFMPRKLKKEKRVEFVNALKAMENVYPPDANPLEDPALSGQWSVVYSSSSRVIRRALRGILAALFKASDPRQMVDTGASSVVNACRARLRMTPLALRLAQKGSFRSVEERKISLDFPRRKGFWRNMLPCLMSGNMQAEVTYLSSRWRICRSGDVTVAFRKIEE